MSDEPQYNKKTDRMIRAAKSIRSLADHYYDREEIMLLMKLHRSLTQIIEVKREEVILREQREPKIILPGEPN